MSKKARNATIIGIAIGLAAIPVVRYIMKRRAAAMQNDGDASSQPDAPHKSKGVFSAYRGSHKPHHRHAAGSEDQDGKAALN